MDWSMYLYYDYFLITIVSCGRCYHGVFFFFFFSLHSIWNICTHFLLVLILSSCISGCVVEWSFLWSNFPVLYYLWLIPCKNEWIAGDILVIYYIRHQLVWYDYMVLLDLSLFVDFFDFQFPFPNNDFILCCQSLETYLWFNKVSLFHTIHRDYLAVSLDLTILIIIIFSIRDSYESLSEGILFSLSLHNTDFQ